MINAEIPCLEAGSRHEVARIKDGMKTGDYCRIALVDLKKFTCEIHETYRARDGRYYTNISTLKMEQRNARSQP